jgi:hypothetical protein
LAIFIDIQERASASNQVPILKPTHIARDHPLDTIIRDISMYKQDQDWLHFVSISHLCHPLKQKKIDEVLLNVDWVNAMDEKLNNFTRNQV